MKNYFIRHAGFCGNFFYWWRYDRCGYTTDLQEALLLNENEAKDFECRPDEDFLVEEFRAKRYMTQVVNIENIPHEVRNEFQRQSIKT